MFLCAARIGSPGEKSSLIGRVFDRIARFHVEAEHVEGLLHMLGQWRGNIDDACSRMRKDQAARQQMQFGLQVRGARRARDRSSRDRWPRAGYIWDRR